MINDKNNKSTHASVLEIRTQKASLQNSVLLIYNIVESLWFVYNPDPRNGPKLTHLFVL